MLKESELKVLNFLTLSTEGKEFISQIARDIGISKGEVSKVIKELKACGLVTTQLSGRNVICLVDRRLPIVPRLRIAFNILEIIPKIETLKKDIEKIILFGSCAEGTDNLNSDIDLFVITKDKERTGKAARKIELSRPIQWIIKTPQEYVVMNNKDKVFIDELSKGITLWEADETSGV